MNILFYVEPWIERDWPSWKNHWLPQLFDFARGLSKVDGSYKFHFIVGDAQVEKAKELSFSPNIQVSYINQKELKEIFPNYQIALKSWYEGGFTEHQISVMSRLVKAKLNGFCPDIIWTFMSPVPFLKSLFPQAPIIHQEVGFLTGGIYPTNWFFDLSGVFSESALGIFADKLLSLPPSFEAKSFMDQMRTIFREELQKENPLSRDDINRHGDFESLLFFPLQYSGHFGTDSHCSFISQFDIICHLLDNLDASVGLVVNEHVNPLGKNILNGDTLAYLRKTYPNFVYDDDFKKHPRCSQYLLDICDGVVSVSSTMGLQALFWKKPLFTIGHSHLRSFANCTDISKIGEVLSKRDFLCRDAMLYYLLTHYFALHTPYCTDGIWLNSFLRNIRNGEAGNDLSVYKRIDSDESLLNQYRIQAMAISDPDIIDVDRTAIMAEIENLKRQIEGVQAESEHLKRSVSAKDSEIDYFRNSWSWKVTGPLRALKKIWNS